jgi:hypothetical protein
MRQQRTSSNTKNFKIFFSKRVGGGGLVIDPVKGLRSRGMGAFMTRNAVSLRPVSADKTTMADILSAIFTI